MCGFLQKVINDYEPGSNSAIKLFLRRTLVRFVLYSAHSYGKIKCGFFPVLKTTLRAAFNNIEKN
jgi:hypothetical protein